MRRFILLDHSIKRIGGHNFEYAIQVLQAATAAGCEPVLAVNQRFFETARVPAGMTIVPIYTHTTYEYTKWRDRRAKLDQYGEFTNATVTGQTTWWDTVTRPIRRWRWSQYGQKMSTFITRFRDETAALCEQLQAGPNDHFLISTLGESEVIALGELFSTQPQWASAGWHLQFHFPLFQGREGDYARQLEQVRPLQNALRSLAKTPGNTIHGYCTTERLAAQYNTLKALPFEVLSWPTPTALLTPRAPRDPEQPLRISVPGCFRPEKGTTNLLRIRQGLAAEFVESRRVQLRLQSHRLGKLPTMLRKEARLYLSPTAAQRATEPVAVVKWPLSSEDYTQFIRDTDIGLLLYEPHEYYARLSSILVEQLAAGIPVLVPAGCWLGDQLTEPNQRHLDQLLQTLPSLADIALGTSIQAEQARNKHLLSPINRPRLHAVDAPMNDVTLTDLEQPQRSTVIEVPARTTHAVLRWKWSAPFDNAGYLRIECAARNVNGMTIQRWTQAAKPRTLDGNRSIEQSEIFPLPLETAVVEWTFRGLTDPAIIRVENLRMICLDAFAAPAGCPLGAVGLIAADVNMAVPLLRDMIRHYDHYRATAEKYRTEWNQRFNAGRIIEQTAAVGQSLRRVA